MLNLTFIIMDRCHHKCHLNFGNDDIFKKNLFVGFIDQAGLSDTVAHKPQNLIGPSELSLCVLPHLLVYHHSQSLVLSFIIGIVIIMVVIDLVAITVHF